MLSNLLDNALHACAPGGRIDLNAHAVDDGVELTIHDDGHGIPADELALVTQRFYRLRADRQHPRTGSGLGLSIVREILERHGTRLELRSQVGGGTSARCVLPTAAPEG